MIVCVDVGNSFVKYALVREGRVVGAVRREAVSGNVREWSSIFSPLARCRRRSQGAIIASVVPSLTPAIERTIRRLTAHRPIVVSPDLRMPFSLDVPHPRTVGADRLCCAAGVIGARRRGAIIVDVGSAITVDLVVGASFKGGVILPGPDISLRALAQHTEKLPEIGYPGSGRALQRTFDTTEGAMRLGAGFSAAGGIRLAVRFLARHAGRSLPTFLTGGAAPGISDSLPRGWHRAPHLVMTGLFRLWELNSTGASL